MVKKQWMITSLKKQGKGQPIFPLSAFSIKFLSTIAVNIESKGIVIRDTLDPQIRHLLQSYGILS